MGLLQEAHVTMISDDCFNSVFATRHVVSFTIKFRPAKPRIKRYLPLVRRRLARMKDPHNETAKSPPKREWLALWGLSLNVRISGA